MSQYKPAKLTIVEQIGTKYFSINGFLCSHQMSGKTKLVTTI
jgi:hypothetical protein